MRFIQTLLVAGVLLGTYTSPALAADDVVLLKSGGRMRGTVVEQTPDGTVRIKLRTGEVREVGPADIEKVQYGNELPVSTSARASQPLAPVSARPGRLLVETDAPAAITVAGNSVGRAAPGQPLTVELPSGRHDVEAAFDDGSVDDATVRIFEALEARITLETDLTPDAKAREGAHLFAQLAIEAEYAMASDEATPRFQVAIGAELGLGTTFTIRPFGALSYLPLEFGHSMGCIGERSEYGECYVQAAHQVLLEGGIEVGVHFGTHFSIGGGLVGGAGVSVIHRTGAFTCEGGECRSEEDEAPSPIYAFGPYLKPIAYRVDRLEVGLVVGAEPAHLFDEVGGAVHAGAFVGLIPP